MPDDESVHLDSENSSTHVFSQHFHSRQAFSIVEHVAQGFTTFITLNQRNTLLLVRNLTDRLILTLPEKVHDLGSTRFYIALTAVS